MSLAAAVAAATMATTATLLPSPLQQVAVVKPVSMSLILGLFTLALMDSIQAEDKLSAPPALATFSSYEGMQRYFDHRNHRRLRHLENPLQDSYIEAFNLYNEQDELRQRSKRSAAENKDLKQPALIKFEVSDAVETSDEVRDLIRQYKSRDLQQTEKYMETVPPTNNKAIVKRNSTNNLGKTTIFGKRLARPKRSMQPYQQPANFKVKYIPFEVTDAREPDAHTKMLIKRMRALDIERLAKELPLSQPSSVMNEDTVKVSVSTTTKKPALKRSKYTKQWKPKRVRRAAAPPEMIKFEISDAKDPDPALKTFMKTKQTREAKDLKATSKNVNEADTASDAATSRQDSNSEATKRYFVYKEAPAKVKKSIANIPHDVQNIISHLIKGGGGGGAGGVGKAYLKYIPNQHMDYNNLKSGYPIIKAGVGGAIYGGGHSGGGHSGGGHGGGGEGGGVYGKYAQGVPVKFVYQPVLVGAIGGHGGGGGYAGGGHGGGAAAAVPIKYVAVGGGEEGNGVGYGGGGGHGGGYGGGVGHGGGYGGAGNGEGGGESGYEAEGVAVKYVAAVAEGGYSGGSSYGGEVGGGYAADGEAGHGGGGAAGHTVVYAVGHEIASAGEAGGYGGGGGGKGHGGIGHGGNYVAAAEEGYAVGGNDGNGHGAGNAGGHGGGYAVVHGGGLGAHGGYANFGAGIHGGGIGHGGGGGHAGGGGFHAATAPLVHPIVVADAGHNQAKVANYGAGFAEDAGAKNAGSEVIKAIPAPQFKGETKYSVVPTVEQYAKTPTQDFQLKLYSPESLIAKAQLEAKDKAKAIAEEGQKAVAAAYKLAAAKGSAGGGYGGGKAGFSGGEADGGFGLKLGAAGYGGSKGGGYGGEGESFYAAGKGAEAAYAGGKGGGAGGRGSGAGPVIKIEYHAPAETFKGNYKDLSEFKQLSSLVGKSPEDQIHGLTYLLAKEMQTRLHLQRQHGFGAGGGDGGGGAKGGLGYSSGGGAYGGEAAEARPQDNKAPVLFHPDESAGLGGAGDAVKGGAGAGGGFYQPIVGKYIGMAKSKQYIPVIEQSAVEEFKAGAGGGGGVQDAKGGAAGLGGKFGAYGLSPNYKGLGGFKGLADGVGEKAVALGGEEAFNAKGYEEAAAKLQSYASKYAFGYRIRDFNTGNDFGHKQNRDLHGVTRGQYHILLPDGRIQNVIYHADDTGFHADVSFESGR